MHEDGRCQQRPFFEFFFVVDLCSKEEKVLKGRALSIG
jgi:hypothetical protein